MVSVISFLCWLVLYWGGSQATNSCPSPPCLFYTDKTTIEAFRLSNSLSHSVVKSNLRRAAAITFDFRRKLIFWSDLSRDVIQSLNLTSGRTQFLVTEGISSVRGMAVDWETGLVYWTDYVKQHISVVTYDGVKRKTLVNAGVGNPHGIAVDPRNGIMFWTDLGSKPRIQKATLSGHNQTTIVNLSPLNQRWPHGITIDYTANRLYWLDSLQDEIMSVDFNGRNRVLHRSFFAIHAFSLDMYGDLLYWSDSQRLSTRIRTINKNHGGNAGVFYNVGYSVDMGIAIYDQSRQPRGKTYCVKGNHDCHYLCLLSPRGPQCACPDGQILNKDNKTCKESVKSILLTSPGAIYQIPLEIPQPVMKRVPLANLGLPNAIDVNPMDRRVYWSDSWQRSISRAFLNGSSQERIVGMVRTPDGLAVDWVAGNLYWTDREANKIEVAKLDGRHRKTLIYKNLERPTSIVLDLRKRYIYWCSAGGNLPPKIERADMTGQNRRVLANLVHPAWPTGVTIFENRLYWIDEFHDVLQYVDRVNPRGVVTVHLSQQIKEPLVLASLDGFLFLLDRGQRSDNGAVVKIDKDTGRIVQTLTWYLDRPLGIVPVDFNATLSPVSQACSQNNGNCSHLCLLEPSGRKCACPNGMTLKDDGKTCYFKEFLLYADAGGFSRRGIYKLSLDKTTNSPVKLPLSNIWRPTALDFDPLEKFVYWTDVYLDRIMRAHLDGTSQSIIITSGLRRPQGLAVDVIGRNLYWTDMASNVIEVSKLNGSSRKVLVSNLDQPKAIALDGKRGYMYWSSWGQPAKIERADMDGENRTIIKSFPTPHHWNTVPPSPNGLALDPETNLLYWIDEHLGMLQYVDLNTRPYGIQNLISSHLYLLRPFGLILNEEHIYWSEQGIGGGIFRTEKRNGNTVRRVARTSAAPRDVHVYHNATAIPDSHPCTIYNGWCTHLCLVVPGGYKCACPTVPTSGRPCLTVPNRPNVTSSPYPSTSRPVTSTLPTAPHTTAPTTTQQQTTTTQSTTTEQPTTTRSTTTTLPTTPRTAQTTTQKKTTTTTQPTTTEQPTTTRSTTTTLPTTPRTAAQTTTQKKTTTTSQPTTTEPTTTTTATAQRTTSTTTKTQHTTTEQTSSRTPTRMTTTPRNPCLSNPCNNKGRCMQAQSKNIKNGFFCQCEEGYASNWCDVYYGENKVDVTFQMKLEDWDTPEFKAGMAKLVNEYCRKNDCQPKQQRRRRSSNFLYFTADDVIVVGHPIAVSNGIKVQIVILEPRQENQSGPRKPMSGSLLCAIMRDTKETKSSTLKGYNILALNGEKEPKCTTGAAAGKSKANRSGDSGSSDITGSAAGAVVGVLCLLILVIIAFYIYRKRKQHRQKEKNETRPNMIFSNPGFLDDSGADISLSNPTYEEIGPQLRDEILGLNSSLSWQEDFSAASNPVYHELNQDAARSQPRPAVGLEDNKLKEDLRVNMKLGGDSNHGNSGNDSNHGNGPSNGNLSNSGNHRDESNEERYVTIHPSGFQKRNPPMNADLSHQNTRKVPENASIPTTSSKPAVNTLEPEYASIPASRSKARIDRQEPKYESIPTGRSKEAVDAKEPEYTYIPTGWSEAGVNRQEPEYSSLPTGRPKAEETTNEQSNDNLNTDDVYEKMGCGEIRKKSRLAPPPGYPTLNGTYVDPESLEISEEDKRTYVNADEINGFPLQDDSKDEVTYINADIGIKLKENSKRQVNPSENVQVLGNQAKGPKKRTNKGPNEEKRALSKRVHEVDGVEINDETRS